MNSHNCVTASFWQRGAVLFALACVLGEQPSNAQDQNPPNSQFGQTSSAAAKNAVADKLATEQAAEKTELHLYSPKFLKASELADLVSRVYQHGSKNDVNRKPQVIVDEASGRFLVSAPQSLWEDIEGLIKKLDVKTKETREGHILKMHPLANGLSEDAGFTQTLSLLFEINPTARYTLDSSRNMLIVFADEATQTQIQSVCDLVSQVGASAKKNVEGPQPAPAMQIRLLWLIDSEEQKQGTALAGDVLKISPVLAKLGINHPRLMSNGLVNSMGGVFTSFGKAAFNNDVLAFVRVRGSCQMGGRNPVLQLDLRINSEEDPKGEATDSLAHVETQIQAPFGHYIILGMSPTYKTTSIFVVQVTPVE